MRPGDVLRYCPAEYHCREGVAFVNRDGRAIDTFWSPQGDGQSHRLTERELESADVQFNVADYDALDRFDGGSRPKWETYHPSDRGRITMQHGLQEALFIRRGATPDLATQIENARSREDDAEREVRSAQSRLELRRGELAELLALAAAGEGPDTNDGEDRNDGQ